MPDAESRPDAAATVRAHLDRIERGTDRATRIRRRARTDAAHGRYRLRLSGITRHAVDKRSVPLRFALRSSRAEGGVPPAFASHCSIPEEALAALGAPSTPPLP